MSWVHELAKHVHQDAYSEYYYDRNREKGAYKKIEKPITDEVIDAHLSGGQAIGVYILNEIRGPASDHYGRCIVFDFDDHDGNDTGNMLICVRAYSQFLDDQKVPHVIVRSGGGNGYHIWIVFKNRRRIDQLRQFGTWVREQVRFKDNDGSDRCLDEGTAGVDENEVELFPKGGKRNVALPLARESKRVRIENGLFVDDGSDDLPLYKGKKRGPTAQRVKADKEAAFTHLAATFDASDYSDWIELGHLLIAAFGKEDEWAKETWLKWASTSDKYPGADEAAAKWENDLSLDPKHTEASFWLKAKDAGYDGPLPFTKKDRERLGILEQLAGLEYVRDPDSTTFAEIAPRRFVPVRSLEFKRLVRRIAYRDSTMLSNELIMQIADTLDALENPTVDVYLRFAALGDKRYFYLGGDDSLVIEIDEQGWRICDDPPVRFRHRGRSLPAPENGDIEELRKFINVDDDNLPFWAAWVVSCFLRPGLAAPIAVLTGPPGSAKSSVLDTTVNLIDPKPGAKAGMPSKEDDLVVAAYNDAIVSYDNASTLAKLSDALCRLATGGGVRKRTLYHDADVTAFDVIRPVIISGIDPTAYNQDLIERLLIIELQPPLHRINDETFKEMFLEARPELLGFILTLVSQVMGAKVEIEDTRMLGFVEVGEATARCLGYDDGWFAEEYRQMQERAAEEAADSDCVVMVIRLLVANASTHDPVVRKTSAEILKELHDAVEVRLIVTGKADIPANARAMTSRIKGVITTLKLDGYKIQQTPRRVWLIERTVATVEDVEACMSHHHAVPI